MVNDEYIINLLNLYAAGEASDEEINELFYWLQKGNHDELIRTALNTLALNTKKEGSYDPLRWEDSIQRILKAREEQQEAPVRRLFTWPRMAAAILFILVTGAAVYYLVPGKKKEVSISKVIQPKKEIPSGKDGAVLTLADGTSIVLDSAANGDLTVQGAAKVVKVNGMLLYDKLGTKDKMITMQEPMFNLLSTPKGRQFQLLLPDGTKVWLNAQSSIRFPTVFVGGDRTVELTGEAYFEVFKDARKPFHVKVQAHHTGKEGLDVQALGTSFNINAYADEPIIQATLIEGSVKLQTDNDQEIIVPGQQGVLSSRTDQIDLKKADTERVLAWKNGYFILNGTSIQAVMRQLSRWYDIEVVYKGDIKGDDFAGEIPRSANLSNVLQMLAYTDIVHFTVDGRKVTVTQN